VGERDLRSQPISVVAAILPSKIHGWQRHNTKNWHPAMSSFAENQTAHAVRKRARAARARTARWVLAACEEGGYLMISPRHDRVLCVHLRVGQGISAKRRRRRRGTIVQFPSLSERVNATMRLSATYQTSDFKGPKTACRSPVFGLPAKTRSRFGGAGWLTRPSQARRGRQETRLQPRPIIGSLSLRLTY